MRARLSAISARVGAGLLIGLLSAVGTIGPTHAASSPAPAERALLADDRADPVRLVYPSQSRVEERSFFSPTLDRTMPYFIYVPPGYDSTSQRFPVAYMLHGMGGSNTEWKGYNLLGQADDLIKAGTIAPMLIVLPQGDQSYWVDHANGPRWGQYTARDVVDEIDEHWRTLADRDHRAIGGLSMGAQGALQLGMLYPDVFGIVGAHSPTLRSWEESAAWFPPEFYRDEAYFDEHDPVSLVEAHPEVARRLTIWIDVGDQDVDWRPAVTDFHDRLVARGVPHEFHVLPGNHNGDDYWAPHGREYLQFYARAFMAAE
jgi:enterochelin esterase-like enzyme